MYKKFVISLSLILFFANTALSEISEPKITKGQTEITLKDGSKKILKDDKACPCYTYKRVIELEDISYYVFDVTNEGAENTYSVLVSNVSGDEIKISGIPVPAPDKKRFVTVTMDLTSKAHESSIEVWDFKSPGSISRTFETKLSGWGASDPVWVDNTALRFYKNYFDEATGEIKDDKPFIFLKLKEGKWEFEEDKEIKANTESVKKQ